MAAVVATSEVVIVAKKKRSGSTPSFTTSYEMRVMAGEFVRNVCVNLGIDPDTTAGITNNVRVWRRKDIGAFKESAWEEWCYRPEVSLVSSGVTSGEEFIFEEIGGEGYGREDHDVQAPSAGSKRRSNDVSPFADDENTAIASAVDCTSLLFHECTDEREEVLVAQSAPELSSK